MPRAVNSHREFFHVANRLVPLMNASRKRRGHDHTLVDVFAPEVPNLTRDESLTFGELMDALNSIARKYRCSIKPPSEESSAITIRGEEAYSISIYMLQGSFSGISNIKDQAKLCPVLIDVAAMLDKWCDVDRENRRPDTDYISEYIDSAQSSLRSTYDQLERFDDRKALTSAQKSASLVIPLFGSELGFFQDYMIAAAAWGEGYNHGVKQAERLMKIDGVTEEDLTQEVFERY